MSRTMGVVAALVACAGVLPANEARGSFVQTGVAVQWGPDTFNLSGPVVVSGASALLEHGYSGDVATFAGRAAGIASFGSIGAEASATLDDVGGVPAVHSVVGGSRFRDELTFEPFASRGARGGELAAFVSFTFKIWGTVEVDAPGFSVSAYAQLFVGDDWSARFDSSVNGVSVETVLFPIDPVEPFIFDVGLGAFITIERPGATKSSPPADARALVDFGNTAHVSHVKVFNGNGVLLSDYDVRGSSGTEYPVPGSGPIVLCALAGFATAHRRRR